MSDLNEIFQTQSLTNISNYSGVYQTGESYKKFDFVYNTGDGLFYYAREDMLYGGGAYISGNNRLSLIPDGPYSNEGPTHYILDTNNQLTSFGANFEAGQIVNLEGSTGNNNGLYKILSVEEDVTALNNDTSLTGAALNVIGVSSAYEIDELELASSNQLRLSEVNLSPEENDALWSRDLFFFDADYGSTVSFKANNYRFEYGNGYYIMQPKTINSLTFEVDLKFENRTNREANAIIHFLENHQGQHEDDKPSPNLEYTLGISGFRWDGNATFHPYDSNEVQTKKFYCSQWSHNMAFENSNNINVRLANLDASLLRKSEQIFINKAEDYSNNEYYEKNDVVFAPENHKFYYWKSDETNIGKNPVQQQSSWTRERGEFLDINTEYWTRDFLWKPSIGLDISQSPRLQDLSVAGGYTQIYNDGINESLLTLNLNFNNRDDAEAYAILHFLEQHYGCVPFLFTPPAPYNKPQNFICEEWSHTYNYKNNHSISVKFEQFPFNFKASRYDSQVAPSPDQPAEVAFINPFVMSEENVGDTIQASERLKKRMYVKNLGDADLSIDSISIFYNGDRVFEKIGDFVGLVIGDVARENYIYQLPSNQNLPFNLNGQYIKLSKSYTDGPAGGQSFIVMQEVNGIFVPAQVGPDHVFFQNNKGRIKKGNSDYIDCNYFINTLFLTQNSDNIIPGKSDGYFDIVSYPISTTVGEHTADISIASNGVYSPINGLIKIYVA
jgi:phage-related protein